MSARSKDPQAALNRLRKKIDAADRALLKAMGARMATVEQIGRVKVAAGMPLLQTTRWNEVMDARLKAAARVGLSAPFTTALYALIHQEALHIQRRIPKTGKTAKKRSQ